MTHPPQTLHDFVSTLLSDATARSYFADDPTGALADAGLQDITPQDVQEVVPLVLSYSSSDGLASLESQLSELPSDPNAAIAHLQVIAQSAPEEHVMTPNSFNMAADGGYEGDPFSSGFTSEGGLDGFTGEMASESDLGSLTGNAWGSPESLGTVGTMNSPLGSGVGGVMVDPSGVKSGLVADSALGSIDATGQLSADQAAGEFEMAGCEADLESNGHLGATLPSGMHSGGGAQSMFGSLSMHGEGSQEGFDFNSSGDPSLSLDGDTLTHGGQFAAGALAGYVSSGGDAFANQISSGGDAFSAYLTGGADAAAEQIDSGSDTMAGHVSAGSDELAGRIEQAPAQMPSPDSLSAQQAPELPSGAELPQGGAPADLPNLPVENPLPSSDLPEAELPHPGLPNSGLPNSDLPEPPQAELPNSGLPNSGLPEAPQPELPTDNAVTEGVSNSPVGNAVPDAPAPDAGGVANDVGLGG
ncbi:MAG: hypothetical protein GEV04_17840 [Actinophytocola sp.]|nr:hypothetical protein [Actinophytocola sp.]